MIFPPSIGKRLRKNPEVLSRFAKYLDRTWEFSEIIGGLKDHRLYAQIPTQAVFLSCFGMFSLRLPSFNELEQQLKIPQRWDGWVGPAKPSADALGYAEERFDVSVLRRIRDHIACQFKRKKALHRLYPDSHWVGALDGIETYKSKKRCCPECLTRELEVAGEKVTEYYHRYVALQLVGATPAVILDAEPLMPGETEAAAGSRLLKRFKASMPRFLDWITMDAFYLQAPFVKEVLDLGYGLVIVLKQENRELYQDMEGLLKISQPETINGLDAKTQLWDIRNLTTWSQLGRPVRAVRSLEESVKRERVAGKLIERPIVEDWRWAVITPKDRAEPTAELISRWGHARWDEETRGFGELTQHWHLNHCYHHHPTAMLVNLLILFLAFALSTVFFSRNLKP
ncbi:MAG: transposase, partial [Patescibacteria group bacterium]